MSNLELLEAAKAITLGTEQTLSEQERMALENLSIEEVQELISLREKIKEKFKLEMLFSPPTHHH